MAEPQPGRPGGGASSGPRSATAATFVVNDASLRDLRRTWQGLTQDVKNFSTELGKLRTHERDLDRLKAKLSALGGLGGGAASAVGAGGAGGRPAGGRLPGMPPVPTPRGPIPLGSTIPVGRPADFVEPPARPDGRAEGMPPAPSTARRVGGALGKGSVALAGGFVAASAAYFGPRTDDISANNLQANYLGRAVGGGYQVGQSLQAQQNAITAAGGAQSMQDRFAGVQAATRALGGTATTGRGAALLRQSGQLTALAPDMGLEGTASAAASLYTGTSVNRLQGATGQGSVGVGGTAQSPTQVFDRVLQQVFRGQPFTAEMITEGMRPGQFLQTSLDYLIPDPAAQELFRQYAITRANVAGPRGNTNAGGNAATANRAINAVARVNAGGNPDGSGKELTREEAQIVDQAGLRDNLRSSQNRSAGQSVENQVNLGEAAMDGLKAGFEALADTTEKLTDTMLKANDMLGGKLLDSAGFASSFGSPAMSALQAAGGIGGAMFAGQGLLGLGRRLGLGGRGGGAGGGGGGAGRGGRALGAIRGGLGWAARGAAGAAAVVGGGAAATGAAIIGGAGVGVAGIVGAARADRSEGMFSERAWKTAYERGLGELHGYDSGYSKGGVVGGHHTRDDVDIKATPGEVVVPLSVVGRHGGAKKLMELLGFDGVTLGGRDRGSHYAEGGPVSADAAERRGAKARGPMSADAAERRGATRNGVYQGEVVGDIEGMHPEFMRRLKAWSASVGQPYKVGSGYRSLAEQQRLYDRWVRRVPGQAKAAKPGSSNHNFGLASDGPHWRGKNPGVFGLVYPMSYEPWHVEPVGAKGMRNGAVAPMDLGVDPNKAQEPANGVGGSVMGTFDSELEALASILSDGAGAAVKSQSSVRGAAAAEPNTATAADPATTTPPTNASGAVALGQQKAAARGWTGKEWDSLFSLWQKESGWNPAAANPKSSARGIPQAMMSVHFGKNWQTSPEAKAWMNDAGKQIDWGLNYIAGRYKAPSAAWAHSQKKNWYERGALNVLQDEVAQLHAGEMVVPKGPAAKLRSMIAGGQSNQGMPSVPQQSSGGGAGKVVSLSITAPVTVVGRATPDDAREFLEMVRREAETESTLDYIGAG